MSINFKFIVNGKNVEIGTQSTGFLLTYEKIVEIAFGQKSDLNYTVVCARRDGSSFSMVKGDSIEAENDLVINVAYTSNA